MPQTEVASAPERNQKKRKLNEVSNTKNQNTAINKSAKSAKGKASENSLIKAGKPKDKESGKKTGVKKNKQNPT